MGSKGDFESDGYCNHHPETCTCRWKDEPSKINKTSRQEGYYWVKYNDEFQIAKYEIHRKLDGVSNTWYLTGLEYPFYDEDFEHINENRIKEPGELPD